MNSAELRTYRVHVGHRNDAATTEFAGYDGYTSMETAAEFGWRAISSWGRDGWGLGSWPYVIIFRRDRENAPARSTAVVYEMVYYVEGDVELYHFPTVEERNGAIDLLAFFHWKNRKESWVEGVQEDAIPDHLRGPFRWNRVQLPPVPA